MTEAQLAELRSKLGGYTFTVEDDPEFPGFFSVYADKHRAGCEVAGKIGEKVVAVAIASTLQQMCK
jgi:hypothetical protein